MVDEYCELELPTKNQHRMSGAANWSQVVYGPGSLRSHGRPQTFWSAKVAKNDIGSECQRRVHKASAGDIQSGSRIKQGEVCHNKMGKSEDAVRVSPLQKLVASDGLGCPNPSFSR